MSRSVALDDPRAIAARDRRVDGDAGEGEGVGVGVGEGASWRPPGPPPTPRAYAPPTTPLLEVVHVDADLLALAKPSGLLTVPGKPADRADCLIARAQARYGDALLVHRLDMDTSGIVVMARNARAQRILGLQFENRQTKKGYVAVCAGRPAPPAGVIHGAIRCDWPNRPLQMIDPATGRPAETRYETIENVDDLYGVACATRVALTPITGRSHQLRVHLASRGHPILGDVFYAPPHARDAAPRLLLHAEWLELRHPADGRPMRFHAPAPF